MFLRAWSGAWRARHRWRSTPARGQVPPTLRARCPAVPTASYHRLSLSTATVSASMVAGRVLAAWRSWRAPIGRFATPCNLALRLVGGRPAGIATWSAYPSIAAAPINPRIDVMGQQRTLSGQRKLLSQPGNLRARLKCRSIEDHAVLLTPQKNGQRRLHHLMRCVTGIRRDDDNVSRRPKSGAGAQRGHLGDDFS